MMVQREPCEGILFCTLPSSIYAAGFYFAQYAVRLDQVGVVPTREDRDSDTRDVDVGENVQ